MATGAEREIRQGQRFGIGVQIYGQFPGQAEGRATRTGADAYVISFNRAEPSFSAANYTVTPICNDPVSVPCWLTVPFASGAIAANSSTAITATINPQGFSPGVYTRNITLTITSSDTTGALHAERPRAHAGESRLTETRALADRGAVFGRARSRNTAGAVDLREEY